MNRMKTFLIYALLVIAIILVTDVIMNLCLNSTYRTIKNYEIEVNSPKIEITEAKTTYVNGIISGTIYNNSNTSIQNSYIKIELLSDLGNTLGIEYLKLDGLQVNETKEFQLSYRYNNVKAFVVDVVDEIIEPNLTYHPLIEKAETYFKIGWFITWVALPPFYLISSFL